MYRLICASATSSGSTYSKHKTENAQSAKKEQPERPTHKEASKKRIQECKDKESEIY